MAASQPHIDGVSPEPLRVLGIDPGLADVGWAVLEREAAGRRVVYIADGTIQTAAGDPTAFRLRKIYRELKDVIRRHRPHVIAVEELFFSSNRSTAMAVAQARGVAILASAETELELVEYSPPRIKQAIVGYGRASKHQVQMLVRKILNLDESRRSDHAADALATALCHLHLAQSISSARAQLEAASVNGSTRATEGAAASTPAAADGAEPQSPRVQLNKDLLGRKRRRTRR